MTKSNIARVLLAVGRWDFISLFLIFAILDGFSDKIYFSVHVHCRTFFSAVLLLLDHRVVWFLVDHHKYVWAFVGHRRKVTSLCMESMMPMHVTTVALCRRS
jgi:hypothetical protein